jgi:hypothetical protein
MAGRKAILDGRWRQSCSGCWPPSGRQATVRYRGRCWRGLRRSPSACVPGWRPAATGRSPWQLFQSVSYRLSRGVAGDARQTFPTRRPAPEPGLGAVRCEVRTRPPRRSGGGPSCLLRHSITRTCSSPMQYVNHVTAGRNVLSATSAFRKNRIMGAFRQCRQY